MSQWLDREGIFKATPWSWQVFKADSGAVAVSIDFEIVAQYDPSRDGEPWEDWTQYETHTCRGNWWVVKKSGQINQSAVDQLTKCLGWTGNLKDITGHPPETVVQINVKEEEYNDKIRYNATWMNPEDFEPTGGGASEEEVDRLQAQFGSLLRAAAGAAGGKPEQREKVPAGPAGGEPPSITDDDIPF